MGKEIHDPRLYGLLQPIPPRRLRLYVQYPLLSFLGPHSSLKLLKQSVVINFLKKNVKTLKINRFALQEARDPPNKKYKNRVGILFILFNDDL